MRKLLHKISKRKKVKKTLFNQWSLLVPQGVARKYRLKQWHESSLIWGFGLLALVMLPLMVGSFLLRIFDLDGDESNVFVLFTTFIFMGFSLLTLVDSFSRRKIVRKGACVLPINMRRLSSQIEFGEFKKLCLKILIIGGLVQIIVSLIVTFPPQSSLQVIYLISRNILAYASTIASIIMASYMLSHIKLIAYWVISMFGLIFFVSLISLTSELGGLEDLDAVYRIFPPYWFLADEGSGSYSVIDWTIHGIIFFSGIMLWKPALGKLYTKISQIGKIQASKCVTRESAKNKLRLVDSSKSLDFAFLRKRASMFAGYSLLTCACFMMAQYHVHFWIIGAYAALVFCFAQVVFLYLESYRIGVYQKLIVGQSRVAANMGLFPLNPDALLCLFIRVMVVQHVVIGLLVGFFFSYLHVYCSNPFFDLMPVWQSFLVGVLMSWACGLTIMLAKLLSAYGANHINTLVSFKSLAALLSIIILQLWPFLMFLYIFTSYRRLEDPYAPIFLWGSYGVSIVISALWISVCHKKKVITLAYLSN